jgi:hypothetical protein
MADRLILDARFIIQHIGRLKEAYPDLAEDADLLADTIEGETDFTRIMEKLADAYMDAVTFKGAIADRLSGLKERQDRVSNKADALKGLMHAALEQAEQRSITLPEATISIRAGGQTVDILNADDLPQGFTATETRPLKAEIRTALLAGEMVPGAVLVRSPDTITVRTK